MDSRRWTVDGGRWAVDGGRWTVDGGRWAVGGGRWAVGGGRWAVAPRLLGVRDAGVRGLHGYGLNGLNGSNGRRTARTSVAGDAGGCGVVGAAFFGGGRASVCLVSVRLVCLVCLVRVRNGQTVARRGCRRALSTAQPEASTCGQPSSGQQDGGGLAAGGKVGGSGLAEIPERGADGEGGRGNRPVGGDVAERQEHEGAFVQP